MTAHRDARKRTDEISKRRKRWKPKRRLSETGLAAVPTGSRARAALGPLDKDAMDVDGAPEPQSDAMDADEKDVLCTVCALTLPPCLPVPAAPAPRRQDRRRGCGVCADELEKADEDDEGDDACAWCDDGGEPSSATAAAGLLPKLFRQRHCGASYGTSSQRGRVGRALLPTASSIESLQIAAPGGWPTSRTRKRTQWGVEARLRAIESELAAAQEALEAETVERQEADIRGELATTHADDLDEVVEAELAEWTRLCEV